MPSFIHSIGQAYQPSIYYYYGTTINEYAVYCTDADVLRLSSPKGMPVAGIPVAVAVVG